MSKTKIIITGVATIALLFAGPEIALATAETAAEVATENESAIADVLHGIVNVLPWPWNAVGGAVIAAGTAIFAWRKTKKQKNKN